MSNTKLNLSIWKKFKDIPLENPIKTMFITVVICLVASLLVTYTALKLRPLQKLNKLNEKRINILQVAGIYDKNKSIDEMFQNILPKVVDIRTGKFTTDINPDFDISKALKNDNLSRKLNKNQDIASIKRQSYYQVVYLVRDVNIEKHIAKYTKIIIPIKGYGLWSTLYGFMAIANDGNTIEALKFYSHEETPGLGGEVDNPIWINKWHNKKIYNKNGKIVISVVKNVNNKKYQVDALSGATLTSIGVNNLVRFWVGKNGFKSFLKSIANGELN